MLAAGEQPGPLAFVAAAQPSLRASLPAGVPAAPPATGTSAEADAGFGRLATASAISVLAAPALLASSRQRRRRRAARASLPVVDRSKTKEFTRELRRSDMYHRFNNTQMANAMDDLKKVSGSEILTKMRTNGFRTTVGDVTFVLAESYGFCWGVERAVAMAYEAKNFFPDKNIWVTNEIIHNPLVNERLVEMGMKIVQASDDGKKDFSGVGEGDVVILPAFGASVDEMALFKEKKAQIVDTTCPWVSKVWNSVERSKAKGHTSIIHGKYDHEETIATKSFAEKYLVLKNLDEAEYVSEYILGNGNREEFMKKFSKAMAPDFDPDKDLVKVGVANQTTMLKGETELIGKLFERVMIKKFGPQNVNDHYISFNTICDATQERQDAMYKMFNAEYVPPESQLYADLEGEQVGMSLKSEQQDEVLSSKAKEDELRGSAKVAVEVEPQRVDICLVIGGFNSSNTTHLLEIAEEENVPGFHVDTSERIDIEANKITHKPLSTHPLEAMMEHGLETDTFLPEGPITIGLTSGASTPDKVVGDCIERLLAIRGLSAA